MIEIQVDTQAVGQNVRAVESGATDLRELIPAVIVRDESGSKCVHAVRFKNGAEVRPYISGRSYGVRVYVPKEEIECAC